MKHVLVAILLMMTLLTGCADEKVQPSSYAVNPVTSQVFWRGSAPDHFHLGSFQVMGTLSMTPDGQLGGGNFQIPIASITNFDLASPVKEQLLEHLKSADFFNLLLYPQASFTIKQVSTFKGPSVGALPGANTVVTGDFTLLGQTHEISFPCRVKAAADSLRAEGSLSIDRTQWGMTSYSDSTATGLYILPTVSLQLTLKAAN